MSTVWSVSSLVEGNTLVTHYVGFPSSLLALCYYAENQNLANFSVVKNIFFIGMKEKGCRRDRDMEGCIVPIA